MSYITPEDRHQILLFQSLDTAIASDHIVRLLDVLVDNIVEADQDFFIDRGKSREGRPAYHPSVFLKLYLYGAMNRINSSRELEKACKRNLELMWLLGKLAPDFKTIADYRKDQGEQIRSLFLRVNLFLKKEGLIKGKINSTDGSKFRAYARQSVSRSSLEKLLVAEKAMLEQYLATLAAEDQAEEAARQDHDSPASDEPPLDPPTSLGQESRLMEAIETSGEKIAETEQLLKQVIEAEEAVSGTIPKRYCTTDPEARMMKGNQGKQWYYNVISSVDGAHALISDIEATSAPTDHGELQPAMIRLRDRMEIRPGVQLGDAGFGPLQSIIDLIEGKIEGLPPIRCFVPIGNLQGQFDLQHGNRFVYHPEQDHYTCVAGEILALKHKDKQTKGTKANVYQAKACPACERKPICTPKSKIGRTVIRYVNQTTRDAYRELLKTKEAEHMRRLRMSLSEHPFATLKLWMGKTPLTLRGRAKVNTQIAIFATAYNILRSSHIKSTQQMIQKVKEFDWSKTSNQLANPKNIGQLLQKIRRFFMPDPYCLALR